MAATVENYVSVYWSGLKAFLDTVDTDLYTDLAANAVVTLELFDCSFLTTAQENQAQALLICIDASEMPSVPGNSQEKFFESLKIADRTMRKSSGLDSAVGAFCRLLKITLKEYNAKTSAVREAQFNVYRTNSVYLAPNLDQRARVFKDYDLEDVRDDRESYPLDSRYGPTRRLRSSKSGTSTSGVTKEGSMLRSVYDVDNDGIVDQSESVAISLATFEIVLAGNALCIGGGLVKKARATTLVPCMGFAFANTDIGVDAKVITDGIISPTKDIDLVADTPVYLSATIAGNVTPIPPSVAGQYIQKVGIAKTTSTMVIGIEEAILLT